MEPTPYQLQEQKFRSFIKLVQYMRQEQQEYFAAKKRHDVTSSNRLLVACLALEKRVDDEANKLLELLQTHFQPELFR